MTESRSRSTARPESSPCVAAAVDGYLLTLTPVAAGARCPAVEPPPFGVG